MKPDRIRTMEQFASVSGISRPTLSKYFNDPTSVRQTTRERIELALSHYDYTPNFYAINQNRPLTRNIGIVVPYLADPFFAEVARKLEGLCAEAGFRPILLSSNGDPEQEIEILYSLRGIRPAGVLLGPIGRRSKRDPIREFCRDIPTVLFDCDIEGVGDAFFGSDNGQSIAMIVQFLSRTGEPPAFLEMRAPPNPNANKRHVAYAAAMRGLGRSPAYLPIDGAGWAFEEIGYREGLRLIESRALPTNTVLCSNDRLAIGFLAAAYEKGLRVGTGHGSALRVAGHDDHPYARFTCPSLTTVSQDYAAISSRSVSELLGILEAGDRSETRETKLFDGTLVVRRSA